MLNPFQFVVIVLAGSMNQGQQNVAECLRQENRVLRERLGERHLRFKDDQRRRDHCPASETNGPVLA